MRDTWKSNATGWILPCALGLTLMMAACATPSTPPTDVTCRVFAPIRYDSREIPAEVTRQIREHNLILLRLCPGMAPA